MKFLCGTTFLWLSSLVASSPSNADDKNAPTLEKVADLLMKGYTIQRRGNLESIVFDEDHFDTHDHGENTPAAGQNLRGLGDDYGSKCVNKWEFFTFSQRYVLMKMFDEGGVGPEKYNIPMSNFDECKWKGINCKKGIVRRIMWKNLGLITQGGAKVYPPEVIYYLQWLEILDISGNPGLGKSDASVIFPSTIDMLEELTVIEYSGTNLTGTFNCSGTSRIIQFGPLSEGVCNCHKDTCYDEAVGQVIDDGLPYGDEEDIIIFGTVAEGGFQREKEGKGDGGPPDPGGNRQLEVSGRICNVPSILWYKISQRYALAELFYHTGKNLDDYAGKLAAFSNNECDWLGVTCNGIGILTKLELNGEGLNSFRALHVKANALFFNIDGDDILPDSMCLLEFMEILDLGNNPFLIGNLPDDFDDFEYLRYLDVSFTQLAGEIECNDGGKSKIVTHGGTIIYEWADVKDTTLSTNADTLVIFEQSFKLLYEGATRFGIKCECHRDTCIFNDQDIRVKPLY